MSKKDKPTAEAGAKAAPAVKGAPEAPQKPGAPQKATPRKQGPKVEGPKVEAPKTEAAEASPAEPAPVETEPAAGPSPTEPAERPAPGEQRTQGVRARADEEVWLNTGQGKVHVRVTDPRRPKATKVVTVRGGARLRLSTEEREYNTAEFFDVAKDPFRNGILRRLDIPSEQKPLDPDYREDQALLDEDILALLVKNGNAFQAAVKALDARNCDRLRELVNDEDSPASQAQRKFVNDHWKATFVKDYTPVFAQEVREEIEAGLRH